jgi:hypothetical protein
MNAMKTTVFALCFLCLCATAALGQASAAGGGLNGQISIYPFDSHDAVAAQHPMGTEKNLLETSAITWAQGERPLWEVAPVSHPTPLGDSARLLRQEHASAKKAEFVWSNN